jgi:hypothetical protein
VSDFLAEAESSPRKQIKEYRDWLRERLGTYSKTAKQDVYVSWFPACVTYYDSTTTTVYRSRSNRKYRENVAMWRTGESICKRH